MDRANLATRAANRNASATRMETTRAVLPNLGQLSLMRTGGTLARGQSPEDVTCVICFHSLAAPPPDGENVWPFDDDPVIWIVACNNQHAFHKGCLRAYARDSERPSRCPECRVPMLPLVLTHVSRPSSGEHARARRARRRSGRRASGATRRRRAAASENLERMQREFQEMDDEGRRMHADAYGDDSDMEEEWLGDSGDEEDPEEVAQRSNLETEQASWSARRDLEWLVELAFENPPPAAQPACS